MIYMSLNGQLTNRIVSNQPNIDFRKRQDKHFVSKRGARIKMIFQLSNAKSNAGIRFG